MILKRTPAVRRGDRAIQKHCGRAFSAASNRKSPRPHHYGQGRRLRALRGTTLVRQRMTSGHPLPFIGPLRGRHGIHYSEFTDSAQRRVQRRTDRLAPPAGSLFLYGSRTTPRRSLTIWVLSQADRTWKGVSSPRLLPSAKTTVPSDPSEHTQRTPQTA